MATERRAWQPDWTVAPGEHLLEALQDRGISQSELARRMDRPTKTINEIVNGKAAITPDTAIQLELTLGISASFWNQLETNYREHLARDRAQQDLDANADWAKRFPVKDLERRNLIQPGSTGGDTVAALLSYFGVGSRTAWEKNWTASGASFRRSAAFSASPEATAAWLRWGELAAIKETTQPFDARRLGAVMKEIRDLTRQADLMGVVNRARALLASAGVVLLLTPEFKGIRLSGAAHWIAADKAVIQLSMRYKSNDHFWFSLFHEAGHLLERARVDYIDADDHGDAVDPSEHKADQFARDSLIPPVPYATFTATGSFTERSIGDFAEQQRIAPGIVVGRLQRDGLLARSHLNYMKTAIRSPQPS